MGDFLKDEFWKHGPKFLLGPEEDYPQWVPEVTGDDLLPPARSALITELPTILLPNVIDIKKGKRKRTVRLGSLGLEDTEEGTVVMTSKIGRKSGPKGKYIPPPTKYPKYVIKSKISTTPEDLAVPGNWDFTGMNPSSTTVLIWNNIFLTNRVMIYEKYSSFFKMVRITAYLYRATTRKGNNPTHLWLSGEETRRSLVRLILIEQVYAYGSELKHIIKHKRWPESSKLAPLLPIIGPRGELRVGGRLQLLKLPCLGQIQIIVPKCPLAVLLIRDTHRALGHAQGRDRLMSEIRQIYWIQGLRPIIDKLLSLCVTCQKKNRAPWQPLMAPLPAGAIPLGRLMPFRNISADFAGPFIVVIGRARHERFVLIYICQHTKGVHAEVTESLGTEHVKNAFTRVFSRKGVPETMRTDNGPSLVAYKNQLWSDERHTELYDRLLNVDWESLREFGGKAGIKDWEFSPPMGPNFNGLAESAVRIWKKAFFCHFRKQTLRLDEFLTATALAEDLINGRPLDYSDGKLYTPAHFMTKGAPNEALPLIDPNLVRTIAMRYNLLDDILQCMWEDFHKGWLYQMQRMPKWQQYRKNLEIGTLVVIFCDDKLKSTRNQWDVGRIVSVKLGADGQVRKAEVAVERPQNTKNQFNTVTHLRPVNKLVPIDLIADQVAHILPVDVTKYPPRVETESDLEDETTEDGEPDTSDAIVCLLEDSKSKINDPSTSKINDPKGTIRSSPTC